MKIDLIAAVTVAAGLATLALAWRALRPGAGAAPPASLQYHARINPNGYTFIPSAGGGGQWTRVTPNGEVLYWADVL